MPGRFLYLWIVSLGHGRKQLQDAAYGQGKPGLNLTNIREVEVAIPSINEQKEIVRRVNALFKLADTLEERYETAKDEAETTSLAGKNPERHQALFGEMMRYLKAVNARMPKVNPDFDPKTYKQMEAYEKRLPYGPFKGRRAADVDE